MNTNYSMINYDPATRREEVQKLRADVCSSFIDLLDFLSMHGKTEHQQTLVELNTTFLALIDENDYLAEKLDEAAASMVALQVRSVLNNPLSVLRIKN